MKSTDSIIKDINSEFTTAGHNFLWSKSDNLIVHEDNEDICLTGEFVF